MTGNKMMHTTNGSEERRTIRAGQVMALVAWAHAAAGSPGPDAWTNSGARRSGVEPAARGRRRDSSTRAASRSITSAWARRKIRCS